MLEEQRPADKAELSNLIIEQTVVFLSRGGVIQHIPFLHTAISGNESVAEYRRIHNRGWIMQCEGFSDARSDIHHAAVFKDWMPWSD